MNQLHVHVAVLLSPVDWMPVHRRVTPSNKYVAGISLKAD